jgi:hypothetical protein
VRRLDVEVLGPWFFSQVLDHPEQALSHPRREAAQVSTDLPRVHLDVRQGFLVRQVAVALALNLELGTQILNRPCLVAEALVRIP